MGAYEYDSFIPTAIAGTDQTVETEAMVTLDGSGSSDPGGETLTYFWTQISGITVTLSNVNAIKPTFIAPSGATSLIFKLEVANETGLKSTDEVTVTVTSDKTLKPVYRFYSQCPRHISGLSARRRRITLLLTIPPYCRMRE